MKGIAVTLSILAIGCLLAGGCTGPQEETVYNSIRTYSSYEIDFEGHATNTNTYTVTGTFTNKGTKPYNIWAGVTVFNKRNVPEEYQGENMTLMPGETKTIVKKFVVPSTFRNKGVGDRFEEI
jgi:hypothetical protein